MTLFLFIFLNRLYLIEIDLLEEDIGNFSQLWPHGPHSSTIHDVGVTCHRALFTTVSADKTIRMWNYHTWKCEFSSILPEEPMW